MRGDVEVADHDALVGVRDPLRPLLELPHELQLVGEFRIDHRVRFVAAGRHIEVVQRHALERPVREGRGEMARVVLVGPALLGGRHEGVAREGRDAVIALLAVDRDVGEAELADVAHREPRIRAFRFLQAQDVGGVLVHELFHEPDAQADRVDVPGGEAGGHQAWLGDRAASGNAGLGGRAGCPRQSRKRAPNAKTPDSRGVSRASARWALRRSEGTADHEALAR